MLQPFVTVVRSNSCNFTFTRSTVGCRCPVGVLAASTLLAARFSKPQKNCAFESSPTKPTRMSFQTPMPSKCMVVGCNTEVPLKLRQNLKAAQIGARHASIIFND